jgi:hypothetical protein
MMACPSTDNAPRDINIRRTGRSVCTAFARAVQSRLVAGVTNFMVCASARPSVSKRSLFGLSSEYFDAIISSIGVSGTLSVAKSPSAGVSVLPSRGECFLRRDFLAVRVDAIDSATLAKRWTAVIRAVELVPV